MVELRKKQRIAACAPAVVHCHGRFQSAQVMNFGPSSLRINGVFGLFGGDRIEIEVVHCRLTGVVKWAINSDIGVELDSPLGEDLQSALGIPSLQDPIFAAAFR